MLRDFPQGEGHWVKGGSHMLIADAALTVSDLMEDFLDAGVPAPVQARSSPLDRFASSNGMLHW